MHNCYKVGQWFKFGIGYKKQLLLSTSFIHFLILVRECNAFCFDLMLKNWKISIVKITDYASNIEGLKYVKILSYTTNLFTANLFSFWPPYINVGLHNLLQFIIWHNAAVGGAFYIFYHLPCIIHIRSVATAFGYLLRHCTQFMLCWFINVLIP
jgi:hypothetical protein